MPGHFTHIYTARRVADHLLNGKFPDWPKSPLLQYDPAKCGNVMKKWEKFTAIGAIGPDLFYFSQDYNGQPLGPLSDELMLTLATYYYFDAAYEDDWEPLLLILEKVNSTMAALLRLLMKLHKIWKDFLAIWNRTIGPLVSDIEKLGDALTGGLLSEFSTCLTEMKLAFEQVITQEAATFADIFTNFNTCVQKGFGEKLFLWSDMSHYRRPSALCQAFVDQANKLAEAGETDKSEQFLAFALGYMTHLGTDTVAHSFVNEQCGGPFRNHPQRHHLIENHIDAWNYSQTRDGGKLTQDPWGHSKAYPDLSMSALWFAVQTTLETPEGDPRPSNPPDDPAARQNALDVDGEMPDWMANSIVQAMMDTFQDPEEHPQIYQGSSFQSAINDNLLTKSIEDATGHGPNKPLTELLEGIAPTPPMTVRKGFPLPWQVKTMYKVMITFYRLQFNKGWELEKPKKPNFIILPPASDFEDLLQPPDLSGIDPSNPVDDVCGILTALVEWIGKSIGAAIKLIEDLIKMLVSPLSYGPRTGLYKLSIMVWDIVTKTHEVMAHLGFAIPHAEQRYPNGELRLPNEIDLPLITLGGTVDAAFREALAAAIDPLGSLSSSIFGFDGHHGLDRDQSVIGAFHSVSDPKYPYYPVLRFLLNNKVEGWEFHRPWAWPSISRREVSNEADILENTKTETYDPYLGIEPENNVSPNLRPGPYPLLTMPDVFFRLDAPVSLEVLHMYETSQTPLQTDKLNEEYLAGNELKYSPLGDPIPFSAYLISQLVNKTGYSTQFNLDSDRAFAYLTWDWVRDLPNPDNPENEPGHESTGILGITYALPKVPPEGDPNWARGNRPLQLKYKDKPAFSGNDIPI